MRKMTYWIDYGFKSRYFLSNTPLSTFVFLCRKSKGKYVREQMIYGYFKDNKVNYREFIEKYKDLVSCINWFKLFLCSFKNSSVEDIDTLIEYDLFKREESLEACFSYHEQQDKKILWFIVLANIEHYAQDDKKVKPLAVHITDLFFQDKETLNMFYSMAGNSFIKVRKDIFTGMNKSKCKTQILKDINYNLWKIKPLAITSTIEVLKKYNITQSQYLDLILFNYEQNLSKKPIYNSNTDIEPTEDDIFIIEVLNIVSTLGLDSCSELINDKIYILN